MNVRCLIVDDEPLARRVIEKYLSDLPAFELTGACASAVEAAAFLHQHDVDLMFLDIQMPQLTGLDFLKTLSRPPKVILTTAYSEYALEGYEYDVMDYLLKPIPFPRFLKAVNKHPLLHAQPQTQGGQAEAPTSPYIMIEVDRRTHRIHRDDIDYLEGYGNFIKVWTKKGMLLTAGPMKALESRLPAPLFLRIHKSYIVRVDAIQQVNGHTVRLKNKALPVGRAYKLHLENLLNHH